MSTASEVPVEAVAPATASLPLEALAAEHVIVEGDLDTPPALGWWAQARSQAGARLSYALLDQVVYSLGNLLVYALYRRHASEYSFGAFVLTQRTLDVMFQLCNVFLWGPFCFHLPGTPVGLQRLYRGSVLLQQLGLCGVFVAALCGLSAWAAGPAHVRYYEVFTPLIWTGIGITFREYTRRMYFADMRFREAFWTEVATVVLQVAGVEWLAVRGNVHVGTALTVLSGGAIAVSFWWVVREWNTVEFSLHASFANLRRDFALGRWLFGTNMVSLLSLQCNPWILSSMVGLSAVGDYNVCEYPVNVPRVALTSLQNTMAPSMARRVAEGGPRALDKLVRRFDRLLLAGCAVFVVIAWLGGRWFAQTIFRNVPPETTSVVVLLAFNLLALACTMARSYGLTAMGRANTTFYVNLFGLAVQAVCVVPLVKAYNLRGAALALLLGTAASALARTWVYRREMHTATSADAAEVLPV